MNLQEPRFPIQRCTAQRIAAIGYGHVAHALKPRLCGFLNHHCYLWPAAKIQSFSFRSLYWPTSHATPMTIEETGKALDASSLRMLVQEFSCKNGLTRRLKMAIVVHPK